MALAPCPPSRKRALPAARDAFAAKKTKPVAVVDTYNAQRKILRERVKSELVAVRRLVKKAAACVSSHGGKKGSSFLAAEAPRSEQPPSAKRRKTPPPATRSEQPPAAKRMKTPPGLVVEHIMTWIERKQVADSFMELRSAALPADILELLQKQSHGCRHDEIEIDVYAMDDEAVYELKTQLDKLAQERKKPSPQGCQQAMIVEDSDICAGALPLATAPSPLQLAEEEEDVDICGGAPRLAIAPSPLLLAKKEQEDVDICGGVSSAVTETRDLDESSGSDSGSSSESDSSESDSDSSDTGSSSDSDCSDCESAGEAVQRVATSVTQLTAVAKVQLEKEERSRARERARQELAEMERTAMSSDAIHPLDLKQLGIAAAGYTSPFYLRRFGLRLIV